MSTAYPASLRTIIRASKARSQPASFSMANPRRGFGYVDPIGTDTPLIWDVTFRFTQAEAALFRLWFTTSIRRGLDEFTMPIRTEFGIVVYTVQFLPDSLLTLREDGEVFEYSAQLMARAESVPPGLAVTTTATISNQSGNVSASFTLSTASIFSGGTLPYTYSVEGTLPPGLSINASTGQITGVPTLIVNATGIAVRATDASGLSALSNTFSINIAAAADPSFSSVALLLHLNGANGSTTFTDNAPTPKTVTGSGGAALSTAQFQYGSASLSLTAASSQRIVAGSHADLGFGTGNFTVEMWVRRTAAASMNFITFSGQNWNLSYELGTNQLNFYDGSIVRIGIAAALPLNTWVHVALTRASGVVRLFAGGVVSTTVFDQGGSPTNLTAADVLIGHYPSSATYMTGFIDDVRLTKGVARYTATFTPPVEQFPDA